MRSNKVDYRVEMEEFSLNCGEIAVCVCLLAKEFGEWR